MPAYRLLLALVMPEFMASRCHGVSRLSVLKRHLPCNAGLYDCVQNSLHTAESGAWNGYFWSSSQNSNNNNNAWNVNFNNGNTNNNNKNNNNNVRVVRDLAQSLHPASS